jgi:hypothetical protein
MEYCARCTMSYCQLCELLALDQLPLECYPDVITDKNQTYVDRLRRINPYRSADFFCSYCMKALQAKINELNALYDATKGKMY